MSDPASTKIKFPRAAALAVAGELCWALKPWTERLIVAGSLRRMKSEVGDVEIIYIPKFRTVPDGLFDERQANMADFVLTGLLTSVVITKRRNARGSEVWGPKNKLARHAASSIPVDLFQATAGNWFNYLVCRTGSKESNCRIARAAQARGWQWNPYGPGFSRPGEIFAVKSEADVFSFVGLPYLEPKLR